MSTGHNTSNLVDIDQEKALLFMKKANLLLADERERVRKDPWPTIENIQSENWELHMLLAEINLLVNPVRIDFKLEEPIQIDSVEEDAHERLLSIREVMKEWRRP